MSAGGGGGECKHEARARGARGGRAGGGNDCEELIARSLWGGIKTLPPLSPLPHLFKRVRESPRVKHAGPLRGQSKTPRLHSRLPAVKGPTTAGRHLASHGWLISAGEEEEEEEQGVSFSEPQKYYTPPFIILSMPPPSVVSLHSSIMLV